MVDVGFENTAIFELDFWRQPQTVGVWGVKVEAVILLSLLKCTN